MISELLALFRMKAEVYHNAKVCGDWLIKEGHLGQTCFHMPTQGSCYIDIPGQKRERLDEGDLVIFPREIPHSMCPVEALQGIQQHLVFSDTTLPGTGLICGRISYSHMGFEQFLDALPKVIIIRHYEAKTWLSPLLALIVEESYRASLPIPVSKTSKIDKLSDSTVGNAGHLISDTLMLDRSCELLFLLALRHYIEKNDAPMGLLSLYGEPKIGKAMLAIHHRPAYRWDLVELARECGMSRTSFSNQFRQLSGWTVMQYLTWWRMQLAWAELAKGLSVYATAEKVGYLSEPAFSRAFKKAFGVSAGQVKRNGIR